MTVFRRLIVEHWMVERSGVACARLGVRCRDRLPLAVLRGARRPRPVAGGGAFGIVSGRGDGVSRVLLWRGLHGAGTRWQADMRSGAGLAIRRPDGL